ncbi:atp4 subunit B of the stator stalk of mitochondrial F1F0 ATP synthase [Dinochytrium kinnereticum]|nr:atp4 subunit B of the stator stalk of mitochondrial F1F0 ATP synthase [Dinochytrium kinnereticum]
MSLLARTSAAASRQLQRSSAVAFRPIASAKISERNYASESKKDPAEAATSLINMFPGATPSQKAGSVLLTSSIAAYLLSKEVYIVDHEFFEMGCLFGAYYIWYSGGKDGAIEYFSERQSTMKKVLEQAREEHKAVVQERINHISKLSDVVDVTKALYESSKEIAKLEAEAYELKQKVTFTSEVKSVLDSWVRHEASVRENEQKLMAEAIIAKIRKDLTDPKLQTAILQQTLADVEKITKA